MTIREKVALALSSATQLGHPSPGQLYKFLASAAIPAFLEAAAEPNERGVSWHMQPAGRDNRRDREEAALKFEWNGK